MGKEEKCWQIILCLEALTEIITNTSQSYDVLDETKEWTFSFQSHFRWYMYDFFWSSDSQTLMCMRTTYGRCLLTRPKVGEQDLIFCSRSCGCCWSDHCTVRNVFCPWLSELRNIERLSSVINQIVHSGSSFPGGSPSLLWCMWKNHIKKETSLILPVNFCLLSLL